MGPKKDKVEKPKKAKSVLAGVTNTTVDLPGFGSSSSRKQGRTLETAFDPDPQIADIIEQSKTGIAGNQRVINQTPLEQLEQIQRGENQFFNLQDLINRRELESARSGFVNRLGASGLENSTLAGSIGASLAQDAMLRDMMTRQEAITQQNNLAANNIGINSSLLGQAFGFGQGLGSQADSNLFNAANSQDQVSMFNAQQQNQANIMNAQLAAQARQRRSALMGNLIGGAASLGGAALLGPVGGVASAGAGALRPSGITSGITSRFLFG